MKTHLSTTANNNIGYSSIRADYLDDTFYGKSTIVKFSILNLEWRDRYIDFTLWNIKMLQLSILGGFLGRKSDIIELWIAGVDQIKIISVLFKITG